MTSGNLRLDRGEIVGYKGSDWRIVAGINATSLLLEDPFTRARQQARIAELTPPKAGEGSPLHGIVREVMSERDRAKAIRRLEAIKPFLIGGPHCRRDGGTSMRFRCQPRHSIQMGRELPADRTSFLSSRFKARRQRLDQIECRAGKGD